MNELRLELQNNTVDCITFGSSSTVRYFLEMIPPEEIRRYAKVKLACIGPITAKTLEQHGLAATIQPGEYTLPALVRAVAAAFARTETSCDA